MAAKMDGDILVIREDSTLIPTQHERIMRVVKYNVVLPESGFIATMELRRDQKQVIQFLDVEDAEALRDHLEDLIADAEEKRIAAEDAKFEADRIAFNERVNEAPLGTILYSGPDGSYFIKVREGSDRAWYRPTTSTVYHSENLHQYRHDPKPRYTFKDPAKED